MESYRFNCPPHLSDVATLPWETQSHFQQYYSLHTSDYLCYIKRKHGVYKGLFLST